MQQRFIDKIPFIIPKHSNSFFDAKFPQFCENFWEFRIHTEMLNIAEHGYLRKSYALSLKSWQSSENGIFERILKLIASNSNLNDGGGALILHTKKENKCCLKW